MRFRTEPRTNLTDLALTVVSVVLVATVAIVVGEEVLGVQAAALEQCQPNCHLGGPVFPTPWGDPLFYASLVAAFVLVVGAAWMVPKVADLRVHGD